MIPQRTYEYKRMVEEAYEKGARIEFKTSTCPCYYPVKNPSWLWGYADYRILEPAPKNTKSKFIELLDHFKKEFGADLLSVDFEGREICIKLRK